MKKAQIWYADFILGFTIFTLTLFIAHRYVFTTHFFQKGAVDDYQLANQLISESLMSKGVPEDWNTTQVFKIGITNGNNDINLTKLGYLHNLTEHNYTRTKELFKSDYDYLVLFHDREDTLLNFTKAYYGKPGFSPSSINTTNVSNVVIQSRFLINRQGNESNTSAEIIKMVIYVWD